jgi:hypothetical protein
VSSKEERDLLAMMAGTTVSFFRSNSELSKLFDKALNEGWTGDRLLAAAKNTKWFKTHSSDQRKALALQKDDPAEWKARVSRTQADIQRMAREMGIPMSGLKSFATLALTSGWNENQIRQEMGKFNSVYKSVRKGNLLGGQLGQAYSRVRQAAFDNGVKVNNKTMATWLQRLASGKSTEQALMNNIQKRAMSSFPGLKEEILGGSTVREFADQYINTMADILELNPQDINLFDKDIRGALNAKNQKGKFSPLSMADFEVRMRKDPRWMKTMNARDSMMDTGREVLQAFGVSW